MRILLSVGLLVFIFKISTAQVLILKDDNFLETVTGHPWILVEFYSPSCPFCQKFAPVYEKSATRLQDAQPTVRVAKVDCTDDAANVTCTKSSVRYVPWIVLFHNGVQVQSFGDRKRDEETIVKFVTDAVNNKSQPEKQEDVTVRKIPPINACDERPPKSVPAPAAISEGLPVTELTDATFADFIKSSPYVIVDYYAPWCSDCQRLSPLFDEAALQQQKTNPTIKFAKVDCNQGNTLTLAICGAAKLKFFPWVVLYHNGQAISHYDQENIPDAATIYNFIKSGTQANDGGSVVKQLDDSNFDSMVSSHPYVLVDFFAPWCFYCKKMAPIYDEVGTELQASYSNVRVVKVDCSANNAETKATCSKNDIAFLPTLKLFQNGKLLKEYEGDKTSKDSILSFVTDVVGIQQTSSKRHSMNTTRKNDEKTGNKEVSKHEKKAKDDEDEEAISDKMHTGKDSEKEKDSHKNNSSKDTRTKTASKNTRKGSTRMDRAAKILKKVFKEFKQNRRTKKTKHRKYEDEEDEDESNSSSNQWQQVVKDIHQVAKDIHKMSKEFHKAVLNKQPAVDRLLKVFSHLMKSKDDDEDDF